MARIAGTGALLECGACGLQFDEDRALWEHFEGCGPALAEGP